MIMIKGEHLGVRDMNSRKRNLTLKSTHITLWRVCQILLKSNMYHEDRVGIIEEKRDEMRK